MIIGLGSDICNIRRVEKAYERFGGVFLPVVSGRKNGGSWTRSAATRRVLPRRWQAVCRQEAFVKALGTGFAHGIAWAEIEVVHLPGGRPAFRVSGQAEAVLRKIIPASRLWLSLSDDYPLAQAVVIIESC